MANEEHLQKLLEGAETWNEWLKEQPEDFRADFSGAELSGAILSGIELVDADLFRADLSGARLLNAKLSRADLRETMCFGTNLSEAQLIGADLDGADLNAASLSGANLYLAKLIGAHLSMANLSKANLMKAKLCDADLTGADLSEAHFFGVELSGAELSGANLCGTDLSEIDLSKIDLSGTCLSKAHLDGADLKGKNLSKVDLSGANLNDADLSNADLSNADLSGANLITSNLKGTKLSGADLSGADLRNCRNLRLDGNIVRNARFSPNAPDPWSVLRRTYTGMRFAFILLALLAFAIPYIISTAYWRGVNQTQGVVESVLVWAENNPDEAPALLLDIATDELGLYRTPCLTADDASCKQLKVWQLLIGFHRGFAYWALAIGLISYNFLRYVITVQVGAFREEEERSGHAPNLKAGRWGLQGYEFYYQLHRIASILFYLSIISLGVHLWPTLRLPVSIPVGGG